MSSQSTSSNSSATNSELGKDERFTSSNSQYTDDEKEDNFFDSPRSVEKAQVNSGELLYSTSPQKEELEPALLYSDWSTITTASTVSTSTVTGYIPDEREEKKKLLTNTKKISQAAKKRRRAIGRLSNVGTQCGPVANVDKAVQYPSRPKTARPGKYQARYDLQESWSSSSESTIKQTDKTIKKARKGGTAEESSSASTYSSVTTFDEEASSDAEGDTAIALFEKQESKTREMLLHRYLDLQLVQQLDKLKSYFERNQSSIRSPRQRRVSFNVNRGRRGSQKTPVRRPSYAASPTILPGFTSTKKLKKMEAKRNLRVLIEELSKYQTLNKKASNILFETHNSDENHQTKPHKLKRRKQESRASVSSDSSSSSYSESELSARDVSSVSDSDTPDINPHQKSKRKPTIQPSREPEHADGDKLNQDVHTSKRKGILKFNKAYDSNAYEQVRTQTIKDAYSQIPTIELSQSMKHKTARKTRSRLSALLSNLGDSEYLMADNHGRIHRVILRSSPVLQRAPSRRRPSKTRSKRRRKSSCQAATKSPKLKKVKGSYKLDESEDEKDENRRRPEQYTEDEESGEEQAGKHPRIRPGSGPIKCNWKPDKAQREKKEPKRSDHQLKNSGNPAVLQWLSRKNEQARQEHLNRFQDPRIRSWIRQQTTLRGKRNLADYERWKADKKRDILLRRRKEALDATGERSIQRERETQSRLNQNSSLTSDSSVTTFSDLRSSAASRHNVVYNSESLKEERCRHRPKSAPGKITLENQSWGSVAVTPHTFPPVKFSQYARSPQLSHQKNDVKRTSKMKTAKSSHLEARDGFKLKFRSISTKPEAAARDKSPNVKLKPENSIYISSKEREKQENLRLLEQQHFEGWMKSNGASLPYQLKTNQAEARQQTSNQTSPRFDTKANRYLTESAKQRIRMILEQKKTDLMIS